MTADHCYSNELIQLLVGLVGWAPNGVLAIFECAVLDCHQIVVGLPAGLRSKRRDESLGNAAGIVVHASRQDYVVWEHGIEEHYYLRPGISHGSTKLAKIPAADHVGHVLKVPISVGQTCGAKRRIADVAEGVTRRCAVTWVDKELNSWRTAAAVARGNKRSE